LTNRLAKPPQAALAKARKRVEGPSADPELEAGSAAHYEDPAYYTKTYKTRIEDVRYYADLAQARGGEVLEYGCGNGRITIPIARHGVTVTGVDLSKDMLGDLQARLKAEPDDVRARVTTKQGDMRRVRLGRRFPLIICPFNAFLHLYTRPDVEFFLARVHEHLAHRGEFVFDISIPEAEELARDPARAYAAPRFLYPTEDGKGTLVKYTERFDYDKLKQVLFVAMEFSPVSGDEPWMTPLAHRQFYPQEIEALLHYNGFEITACYGGFDERAPSRDSILQVIHAKKRRKR
jgi:SAM-dependent methyltransferase